MEKYGKNKVEVKDSCESGEGSRKRGCQNRSFLSTSMSIDFRRPLPFLVCRSVSDGINAEITRDSAATLPRY